MRTLEHNLRFYPVYAGLFHAYFWMPVFFLFFSEHLTLAQVLKLEAIYYAAVVLLEVPSGYFSDTIGRRPTLIASTGALTIAYLLFLSADTFAVFAAAQVLLAAGLAFNSGTDVSFHFDSLVAADRAEEFDDREARVSRIGFLSTSAAAVLGGALAMVELRLAYAGSLVVAAAGLVLALSFVEPPEAEADRRRAPLTQFRNCLGYLRRPRLGWLFAVAVVMVVINHIPYEFYQPYLRLLEQTDALGALAVASRADTTPLIAGLLAAATGIVAGVVAGRSIALRDRLGLGPLMLGAVALQTAIMATMGLTLHVAVLGMILLRSVPRALYTAPLNAAIAPRIGKRHRATYFSLQSLAGRLSFSGFLLALSVVAGGGETTTWPVLSRLLLISTGVGLVLLILLALTVGRLQSEPGRG